VPYNTGKTSPLQRNRDTVEPSSQHRRIGDYEILEEIGRGGMGVVYRAQHAMLNQIVALKVVSERDLGNKDAVSRFRREMRTIGGLSHPNIVRAHNAGEHRGMSFLATEFVDGTDLQQLVAGQGPVTVGAACELVRQAAVGLQYIHQRGLVHCDIKPANLMLALDGTVRILDLGIARFQIAGQSRERVESHAPAGTVDYMAPEQWIEPAMVDIRADIYGLGCTLFYLLTGDAPSAQDARDTTKSRSGPTLAATIAPMSKTGTDPLADIDVILTSMLAEDPDQRFDTPDEVAAAMEPYARHADVDAILTAKQEKLAGSVEGVQRFHASASDRPQRTTRRLRQQQSDTTTRGDEKDTRDRIRPIYKIVAVAAAIAALVGVAWLLLRFNLATMRPSGPPPVADAGHAVVIAGEVCALPGLNGRWWFDEMPWLLPPVRQAIARELTETPSSVSASGQLAVPSPPLDPNTATAQGWLLKMVDSAKGHLSAAPRELLDDLLNASKEDLRDAELSARLQNALDRFTDGHGNATQWHAMDLHTRAVLEHKIAMIENDRELASQSIESYRLALADYQATSTVTTSLRSRCLIDCGMLQALVLRDYAAACQQYDGVLTWNDAPLLLQAEAWLGRGIASAAANKDPSSKYTEAGQALTRAQDLLRDSPLVAANHPFVGHAHERFAWILMDQWEVRKANDQFKEARNIRFDNFWKSKNAFSQIFVFHNDHGQAMAERYCGDVRVARAQYDLVIGEIEKTLAKAETDSDRPGLQRFRRDLRERLSNSCERRADCELYQGAASGSPVDLAEAIRLYTIARDKADDPAARVAMSYKRAIMLALDGRTEEAEKSLRDESSLKYGVIGVQQERVQLLSRLTEAVLQLKKPDVEGGIAALRAFLNDLQQSSDFPDRYRRETFELQLFAAELLIATQLAEPALRAAAVGDAAKLEQLLAGLPNREQMLPYLRRCYDLVIETVADGDPGRAATLMLAARGKHPSAEATSIVFHFAPQAGRVIILPVDRPGVGFALKFGRDHIKEAVSTEDAQLALPEGLVDLVVREQSTGRTVAVVWDDQACWAKPDAALTAADWPFDHQLKLATFQTPASEAGE
jgi:serine/threonine protein kinase/tetratricopeptide (TPR) repeat protein